MHAIALLTDRPPAELTLRRIIAQCRGAENPRGRRRPDIATADRQTQKENALIGLHWNYINFTGDYSWRQNKCVENGVFRPLGISQLLNLSVLYFPFGQAAPGTTSICSPVSTQYYPLVGVFPDCVGTILGYMLLPVDGGWTAAG